jgi:hypothetical protein
MEEIEIGKYQVVLDEERVTIKRDGIPIYSGKLYNTLLDFLKIIKSLPEERQEYELELAFDI